MTASLSKSVGQPAPRRRRNNKFWIFVLVLFVSGIAIGAWSINRGGGDGNGRLGRVERGDILQRVTIAGTVVPNRRTVITAPYSGYVQSLYVKVGQAIKKNEPVVTIVQALGSNEQVFPIRAPFDGMVVQVGRLPGEYLKENDPKDFVARIDDLTRLFIEVSAPEIDVVKLKNGQEAIVKASAILNRSYKGIVREMALAARMDEGSSYRGGMRQVEFPLRIEIVDKDAQLMPGMSTVIDIIANKKENVLTLGHEFLNQDEEKYYVVLANGERREVQVGAKNEESFEITSGLNEGDQVRQIDFFSLIEANKKK